MNFRPFELSVIRRRILARLDASLRDWNNVEGEPPPGGWLRNTREALGMRSSQLAARLGVSKSAVTSAERAEVARSISLATLERYASALECRLVYVLVPKAGTLSETLEAHAEARYRATAPDMNENYIPSLRRSVGSRDLVRLWAWVDGKRRR